ncbi:MAG: GrpB family protein [Opitutaceae bacterium]
MHLTISDELAPGLKDHLALISEQLSRLVPRGEFHHIGATAIPGSLTKGDVDVLLRVDALDFPASAAALQRRFEINQPENWTDVFASFKDELSFPFPLGVQLVVKESEYDFFLFLVDYFTSNAAHLAEYNRIKQESALLGADEYRNAKERYLTPIVAARQRQG